MTLASLFLVVLASFIHASWNLLAKRAAAAGPVFVLVSSLLSFVIYAPWALYQLTGGGMVWTWAVAGMVLLSGLVHLAYSLCLQRGYQLADLSVVYPVARGSAPLLASIGAFVMLGEGPAASGLLGLALVVAGIWLIATQGRLAAFARPGGQAGLRWGAATGGLIASYTVIDAVAVKQFGVVPVVLDWLGLLPRILMLAPLVLADPRRAVRRMRGCWGLALGVGVLSPLSYILVLIALSRGAPLSLVAPMREMSMMLGVLMGMLILREAVGPSRLAGCAAIILGAILLSLS